ncbi:MAG: hypothetical protein QXR58_02185 [Candidatus Micrarchaeaceae archaeon]
MEMEGATLARGPHGEARFDYVDGKRRNTILIEKVGGGVLETLFDEEGAVLKQVAFKGDAGNIELEVEDISKRIGPLGTAEYNEVTLRKSCPNCGKAALRRSVSNENGGVPIVPTYVCTSCKGRSYYLTDQYLRSLVLENKGLFSKNEIEELERNEEDFFKELKEYIIRIFASKKIMAIK